MIMFNEKKRAKYAAIVSTGSSSGPGKITAIFYCEKIERAWALCRESRNSKIFPRAYSIAEYIPALGRYQVRYEVIQTRVEFPDYMTRYMSMVDNELRK